MQDRGLGGWSATIILALIGLFNILALLGMGYLGTKYSKKILLSILYFLEQLLFVYLFFYLHHIYSYIFWITFGCLWLSTVPPTNGIVAQIFGTKYLKHTFWNCFFKSSIGAFAGAFLGGLFYDLYGSYDYAWYIAIALITICNTYSFTN